MAELKPTRAEMIRIIAESQIVAMRYQQQQLKEEIERLSLLSKEECVAMSRIGTVVADRLSTSFRHWDDPPTTEFSALRIAVVVPHASLPPDVRARRERMKQLHDESNRLSEEIDKYRNNAKEAVIMTALSKSDRGRQIIELLKGLKLEIEVPPEPIPAP